MRITTKNKQKGVGGVGGWGVGWREGSLIIEYTAFFVRFSSLSLSRARLLRVQLSNGDADDSTQELTLV